MSCRLYLITPPKIELPAFADMLARALDEFIYHRKLKNAEIDLHAKTHFGFLIFVIGLMAANWLQTKSQ